MVKKAGLSVALGDEIQKELNKKIKTRFQTLKQENDKEAYVFLKIITIYKEGMYFIHWSGVYNHFK